MITIVARWEQSQMPPEVEWRMWRQLKAFGINRFVFVPIADELRKIDIEQYATMEEALDNVPDGNRVFLEPTGNKGMNDLPPRDKDVVFILGKSSTNNVKHAKDDETYRIKEPMMSDMYPTSAGAIALAFWYGQ